MEKRSFFKNTAILFAAMFVTKIIGAVLKIPLTNMLGGNGMAYFSTAYSFFNPVYTVLAAGLPTIVTKLAAQSAACGRYREARAIKKAALEISTAAGVFGVIFIIVFAKPFADHVANSPESLWSVLAIAPSVLFCCVASAYRGYYEGLSDMLPTAVSQVIESAVKAVFGLGLSGAALYLGSAGFIAEEKTLPYAAAAAVLGVSFGELCGTLFLALRSKLRSDSITKEELDLSPVPTENKKLLKKIFKETLPISLGSVIMNLSSFIDLLTISGGIRRRAEEAPDIFAKLYPLAVSEAGDSFGNFVYGSYTGIVLSVFMLITSLTSLIVKSALPNIAASYECGEKGDAGKYISVLLSGIFVIGLPLCFSLGVLAEPVLSLLYPVRAAEVSVSVEPLSILCFGGISIAVCGGLFSVFQAIGRSDIPIKLMMIGSALKLGFNLLFLEIPRSSISGAALSTVLSQLVVMVLGFVSLRRAGVKIDPLPLFIKPAAASAICAAAAYAAYYALFDNFGSVVRMCFTVLMGVLAYVITLPIFDRGIFRRFAESKKRGLSR